MDDLIGEFIAETNESLGQIDVDLVTLEQNPGDQEILGNIFRLMHTIKGTCGFLGLPRLEKVAHHAENVLGRFRDGDLEVKPAFVTLIFESIDRIKSLIEAIEETGEEGEGSDAEIIAKLDAVFEGRDKGDGGPVTPADGPVVDEVPREKIDLSAPDDAGEDAHMSAAPEMLAEIEAMVAAEQAKNGGDAASEAAEDAHMSAAPEMLAEIEAMIAAEQAKKGDDAADSGDDATAATSEEALDAAMDGAHPTAAAEMLEEIAKAQEEAEAKKKEAVQNAPGAKPAATKPGMVQSLRVNVDVLENLMTMVSELVLTRNQLLQIMRNTDESDFAVPLQRLNHVVSELQEGVMKTRMQPIGNAWSKLPRIIRDISMDLGKKIDLEMNGQETELDRQVLDLIKDPLTHMVRNSADHGIETPDVRAMMKKPETGRIVLNAFHEGGHIIIEIKDDGKGLNTDRIKEKAIENGVASADEIEQMSNKQIHQFIFAAGFSTAEKVTSVSGRGVGMDVVRTNIEKIGGAIDLTSVEGKGSTFSIKIPLTLAIVSALVVESGGERFAIPQLSVQELVMASHHGENKIEMIKGTPVFRLRDRLLPLVNLSEVLGTDTAKPVVSANDSSDQAAELEADADSTAEAGEADTSNVVAFTDQKPMQDNRYIVVLRLGGYSFGIVVDRVFDTEEIVVKPVANILKEIPIFSGNTILGDGSVIMILDPAGIAKATGEISVADTSEDTAEAKDKHIGHRREKTSMLLFRAVDETPRAVQLALVARLEDVDLSKVENAGGQMMVQYRGALMPLIKFDDSMEIPEEGIKPTLVFSDGERSMGLFVDEILDIVDDYIDVQLSSENPGFLGSAILRDRATDVVDVAYYLNKAFRDWFNSFGAQPAYADGEDTSRHLLLVDDSAFFRNMVVPLLEVEGYTVTSVSGPTEALELYDSGQKFDLIISDIEMPDMNGFDFATAIKEKGNGWSKTPLVAMSSHATPDDIKRGYEVGFDKYVPKFDRDTLLNTLSETLTQQPE